jgi:putative membrane protein
MMKANRIAIVCVVGALAGGTAAAADAPDTAQVLGKLHRSNQKEIEMGKMAQDHGLSKDVKDFGVRLVKDHSAADKKVAKLAKDEKVDLTASTPPADSHDMKATGAAFDEAFAKDMLADHKKDVAEVTRARDATADPKLKKLLSDILPVLKRHQDTAQKLVDNTVKNRT